MIEFLSGNLVVKEPVRAVINVQGIGYEVFISLHTFDSLGDIGIEATLFTHLHVREDAMLLYGFASAEERSAFRMLIAVSGIGAKVAMAILSGLTVKDLGESIAHGNVATLTSIPGIGKKTAERLVLELRDKFGKGISASDSGPSGLGDIRSEAMLALSSLGYSQQAAEKAIMKAISEDETTKNELSALIKLALRLLTK
jgi:holliday junction DNA helicase RuvA